MNELEKMINGFEYFSGDKDLEEMRNKAKDLCFDYNFLKSNQQKEKEDIIRKLFGKIGKNFGINAPFYCDYGFNIEAGDNLYINHNCVILDCAKVKFGNNVFIAPNCGFYTAGHPLDIERRNNCIEYAYPITIGNDIWIGANTIVIPGVTIGNGSVIGAGSVVVKDIPNNVIAFGNPCKIIREITDKDKEKNLNWENINKK
ncbi:sugar O-acetyltransferase [uncultured Brachyspira sp.]|uniref:sugar O-acetyltransferase n=1 Tax=uncultured Brachyspira sp. TaxID=221953 RepID=UPI002611AA32|nr:sugar O-acetyltransferase [uncultured Brachyspira sp.]